MRCPMTGQGAIDQTMVVRHEGKIYQEQETEQAPYATREEATKSTHTQEGKEG